MKVYFQQPEKRKPAPFGAGFRFAESKGFEPLVR